MWFEQLPRPVARDIGCFQYWATSLVLQPVSGGLVSPPARLRRGLLFSVGPVPFGMDSDLAPMAGILVLHALWGLARAVWRCTCRRAVPILGAQLRVCGCELCSKFFTKILPVCDFRCRRGVSPGENASSLGFRGLFLVAGRYRVASCVACECRW